MPNRYPAKGLMSLLCIIVLYGCSKKSDPPISINHSSNLYVNKVIRFSGSGAAENCSWNFGDGATAQGREVAHVYAQPGQYNVTLETPGKSFRVLSIGPDSALMASLAGTMMFHQTDSIYRNMSSHDTIAASGVYPDVSMAATLVSPTTILFNSDTLTFDSTTSSMVYFHYNSPALIVNPYTSTFTLNLPTGEKHYIKRKHIMASATQITHFWTY